MYNLCFIIFFIFLTPLVYLFNFSLFEDDTIIKLLTRSTNFYLVNDQSSMHRLFLLHQSFILLDNSLLGSGFLHGKIWHDGLITQLLSHFGLFGFVFLIILFIFSIIFIFIHKISNISFLYSIIILSNFITEYYLVFKFSLISFSIIFIVFQYRSSVFSKH